MSRVPILAIFGSTGCGKSRLAIELASRFSGEIISADSMQLYKGLDIITAKVTKEEQKIVRHHMLDILDPLLNTFTAMQFRNMAIPIVDDLLDKGKLPIIVGGTNYYMESILWKVLITDGTPDDKETVIYTHKNVNELDPYTETSEELYEKLKKVDPEMAKRIHPKNRRKIVRSLIVFEKYGVPHFELLKAQRAAGGSGLGGPLRNPNCIILWLRCDMEVLEERLESRVDTMIETGLVEELLKFHRRYNEHRIESNEAADYTKGIFQSIGFKEFHDYLVLPEEEKQTEKGKKLLEESIKILKLVTKRYARKQQKWVMNRIILRKDRQVPPVYVLDATNLDQWNSCVYEQAVAIVEAALKGEKPKQKPLNETVQEEKITDSSNQETHHCEICDRFFIGEQWDNHLRSMKHMRVMKKKRKLEEQNKTEANT